jgi:hypothetical protein
VSFAGWFFSILGYAIAIVTIGSVTYDIWAMQHQPRLQTISGAIHDWARQYPVCGAWLIGMVLGVTAMAQYFTSPGNLLALPRGQQ